MVDMDVVKLGLFLGLLWVFHKNCRGSQYRTIDCTHRIWSRLNMAFNNEACAYEIA